MVNIKSYIEKYGTRIWLYHPESMSEVLIYSNPWLFTLYKSFILSKLDFYQEKINQDIRLDILVSRNFKLYSWINISNWEILLNNERDYHLLPLLLYLGKVKPVDNFRKLVLIKWNKSFYKRKSILLYRHSVNLYSDIPYNVKDIERYNEDIYLYNENSLDGTPIKVIPTSLIKKLNLLPYEDDQPLINNSPYSFS